MEAQSRVTVIIPCFNEEASLPSLLERLGALIGCRAAGWQVLFVDDGSSDASGRLLEAAALAYPWISVLRHSRNLGLGAALRTGFRAAATPIVCTIDSDCSYPPERLPELVEAVDQGADIVTGSPWHPENSAAEGSPWRIMLSRGASRVYRRLTGARIHTYTCLFRAWRTDVARDIPFESDGFPAVCEILVRGILAGCRVDEIPMPLTVRRHGVSKMRPWKTIVEHLKLLVLTVFWVVRAPRHATRN